MPYVKLGRENSGDIEMHYEDHGSGTPVVLSHGYPLNGHAWEKQVPTLLDAGYRVITYDRRGWGGSSQPAVGYDYDTFAADLNALVEALDIHDAVLVGHSMGSGDVAHYLGRYGSARVSKAVLVSPIPPYFVSAPDDPDGVPQSLFEGFKTSAITDRPSWLKGFLDNFYNIDVYAGSLVTDEAFQASLTIALEGSPIAAVECIQTWATDFRSDVASFNVPILVIQGDQDRVLPIQFTGNRLKSLTKDLTFVVIEGGPHAISWTHSDQVNKALLDFLN
ncbi:alpha/beta hydrolase [Jatrophihabitans telluris]|uniref:Alpha/beta hydrolase n=1 Tax=Jatrophihabitans telluris TaxID=2038343 RepID=A0ABY4QVE5_9ACTN|nr:alpha/beta hydrolase [Jatrophihabitans telluris]UQX87097.1 alpha/beta hydrolase [Jatrophihabitans telluris]